MSTGISQLFLVVTGLAGHWVCADFDVRQPQTNSRATQGSTLALATSKVWPPVVSARPRIQLISVVARKNRKSVSAHFKETVVKTLAVAVLSIFFASFTPAQSKSSQPPAAPPQTPAGASSSTEASAKIDPGKEADIRHLLDVGGTKSLMSQVLGNMDKSIRPILMNSLPPGDYRARLIDLFLDKFTTRVNAEIPKLLDAAVPIYDKYLSDDEIKGLIQFYQTPLGRKALSVLPQITIDMQAEGQKLGQQIGQETMLQVLSEHPDLAKAMQDAGTAAGH